MQRSIRLQKLLPAFSLSLTDLEEVIGELKNAFGSTSKPVLSIQLSSMLQIRNTWEFHDIAELRQCNDLPTKNLGVFILTLKDYGASRYLEVKSDFYSPFWTRLPVVEARAAEHFWCAGVVAETVRIIGRHKVWYSAFLRFPVGLLYVVSFSAYFVAKSSGFDSEKRFFLFWSVLNMVFCGLMLYRLVLRASVIRTTKTATFFERYYQALTLLVAVAGLAIAILTYLKTLH